ncbi:hypothetical protein BY996DRAFT_6616450 [Phakopsora pachyrhizi]|nr:hypothetical protein BY996DRAFT_6616450 [Phakopsora pachyrhizi]
MRDFDSSPDLVNVYPLAKSILAKDLRMIGLFLKYGARLDHKNFLVVNLAIRSDRIKFTDQMLERAIKFKNPSIIQYFIDKGWSNTNNLFKCLFDFLINVLIFTGARPTLEAIRLIENL